MNGREHVAFDDIKHYAPYVLQHRMLLNYDGQAEQLVAHGSANKVGFHY